jgi:hypothetical protein
MKPFKRKIVSNRNCKLSRAITLKGHKVMSPCKTVLERSIRTLKTNQSLIGLCSSRKRRKTEIVLRPTVHAELILIKYLHDYIKTAVIDIRTRT